MKKIRCNDCYELNEQTEERCIRCGRLLEDAKREQLREHFEFQHEDAPDIVVKRPAPRKVW